jgi:CubicO group peptidase (beta-lactamase class C family)
MRSLTILATLLFTLPAIPISGQVGTGLLNNSSTKLQDQLHKADSLINCWVDSERIPGAVVLVSKDGETLLHKAYGWSQLYDYGDGQYRTALPMPKNLRRLHLAVPMSIDTRSDLASVTKVMATTFAVMLLVDRNQMELDAPIYTYLADFRGEEKDHITVQNLLTHRSGLQQWQPIYYHASNTEESYRFIRDLPLGWDVGEEYHYSDLGFMLLGMIVEKITGEQLDQFLNDHLYSQLGLMSIGFSPKQMLDAKNPAIKFAATSHGNPYEHRMVHDTEFGYTYPGNPDQWNDWRLYTLLGEVNDGNSHHAFSGVAGHAGLFSNAVDLQTLLNLLIYRGVHDGKRYLKNETVELFWNSHEKPLGWQKSENSGGIIFSHSGFTGTFVAGIPTEKLAIVLLTNRQNNGLKTNDYYESIALLEQELLQTLTSHFSSSTESKSSKPRKKPKNF